jgi:hypothetical protein
MTDITIPPEALEAASRAFAANKRNWQMYAKRMEAACLAMLNAWPDVEVFSIMSDDDESIILPLPKEPSDDK